MTRKYFVLFFTLTLFISACGGTTTPNANGTNGNTATGNSNNPLAVTTPTPETTTNNAPTLTPYVKVWCEAMAKNDEAAVRKVYSSDTIQDFEEQMKAEKIKGLMKFLEDDRPSGTPCDAKNEKITGDEALVTIVTNIYPQGLAVKFIKQNGDWKMTNFAPAINSVKQTATNPPVANGNANAAKK